MTTANFLGGHLAGHGAGSPLQISRALSQGCPPPVRDADGCSMLHAVPSPIIGEGYGELRGDPISGD